MGIDKTAFRSWKTGQISKGCSLCVEGRKSVLFATGICPADCYYCPISDKKKGRDVVYINEWPTKKFSDKKRDMALQLKRGRHHRRGPSGKNQQNNQLHNTA